MEWKIKMTFVSHGGFALPLVLIVTAIGALFGAGSLLLFKYQCHRRIDRQHELEKVYAVRSAANYARVAFIPDSTANSVIYNYKTSSDRLLELEVQPVEKIFPNPNKKHLDIANEGSISGVEQYNVDLDYEYGSISNNTVVPVTESQICTKSKRLTFCDKTASNGVKWWVNIGLNETGGWLHSDYGRRYSFSLFSHGPGQKDVLRLCIICNTNHLEKSGSDWIGCRRGWPLSEGERALMLESSGGSVILYDCFYGGKIKRLQFGKDIYTYEIGMQLAGSRVYLFYRENVVSGLGGGIEFVSDFWDMRNDGGETYDYFLQRMCPDSSGTIPLDVLRAVIECEASSDQRPYQGTGTDGEDAVRYFRVTPAYQYDIKLKCPGWDAFEEATVVQKVGSYDPELTFYNSYNIGFKMKTYNTHGTAWKGYKVR